MYLTMPLEARLQRGRPFERFNNTFIIFRNNNIYLERPLEARLQRGRPFERFNNTFNNLKK